MVMPVASMIWAWGGILTEPAVPTAGIFPACIITTPFSITPWVVVWVLPPFRAMGGSWAGAGLVRGKIKINSSGQECPLHTGPLMTELAGAELCSAGRPRGAASPRFLRG